MVSSASRLSSLQAKLLRLAWSVQEVCSMAPFCKGAAWEQNTEGRVGLGSPSPHPCAGHMALFSHSHPAPNPFSQLPAPQSPAQMPSPTAHKASGAYGAGGHGIGEAEIG